MGQGRRAQATRSPPETAVTTPGGRDVLSSPQGQALGSIPLCGGSLWLMHLCASTERPEQDAGLRGQRPASSSRTTPLAPPPDHGSFQQLLDYPQPAPGLRDPRSARCLGLPPPCSLPLPASPGVGADGCHGVAGQGNGGLSCSHHTWSYLRLPATGYPQFGPWGGVRGV